MLAVKWSSHHWFAKRKCECEDWGIVWHWEYLHWQWTSAILAAEVFRDQEQIEQGFAFKWVRANHYWITNGQWNVQRSRCRNFDLNEGSVEYDYQSKWGIHWRRNWKQSKREVNEEKREEELWEAAKSSAAIFPGGWETAKDCVQTECANRFSVPDNSEDEVWNEAISKYKPSSKIKRKTKVKSSNAVQQDLRYAQQFNFKISKSKWNQRIFENAWRSR